MAIVDHDARLAGRCHRRPGGRRLCQRHVGCGHVQIRFDLADDRRVVCGISFGYPDRAHKANGYRTTRAALADAARFFDE